MIAPSLGRIVSASSRVLRIADHRKPIELDIAVNIAVNNYAQIGASTLVACSYYAVQINPIRIERVAIRWPALRPGYPRRVGSHRGILTPGVDYRLIDVVI